MAGGRALFDRVTPSAEEHSARRRLFASEAASTGAPRDDDPYRFGCYPASNLLECRHSNECSSKGRCYYDYARCVAATDAACRRSSACRDHQRCRFDAVRSACVP